MTNRFHDLTFERLSSGAIRLKQQSDLGEPDTVDLHPTQLEHVASAMLGRCEPGRVRELERRIGVLTDKLQNIVCNDAFRGDLLDRCGDGFEYLAKLDAVLDLALEFDGGRLEPRYKDDPEDELKEEKAKPLPVPVRFKPMEPPATHRNVDQMNLNM